MRASSHLQNHPGCLPLTRVLRGRDPRVCFVSDSFGCLDVPKAVRAQRRQTEEPRERPRQAGAAVVESLRPVALAPAEQ
jgi:hypothetical protein